MLQTYSVPGASRVYRDIVEAMTRSTEKLSKLDRDVKDVTNLLKDNVEKVLERGDKIDSLQERSEDLESNSLQFKKSSRRLRNKMCCQNAKATCILVLVIVIIIAIVVVIILVTIKPWNNDSKDDHGHHGNNTLLYHGR